MVKFNERGGLKLASLREVTRKGNKPIVYQGLVQVHVYSGLKNIGKLHRARRNQELRKTLLALLDLNLFRRVAPRCIWHARFPR
jgi:hypothetical protein